MDKIRGLLGRGNHESHLEAAEDEERLTDAADVVDEEHLVSSDEGRSLEEARCTRPVRCLATLSTVLGLMLAVFFILFVINILPAGRKAPAPCQTGQCIRLAQDFLRWMDPSVDPCTDFYSFACGGWLQNHQLRDDVSHMSQRDLMWWSNLEIIKNVLETGKVSPLKSVEDAKRFYRSCMHEEALAQQGVEPMMKLKTKLGLNDSVVNITTLMSKLTKQFLGQSLFSIGVYENMSKHIIKLSVPQFSLPLLDYLNATTRSTKVLTAYQDYMVRAFALLGTKENVSRTLKFEIQLAKLVNEADANSKTVSISQLQEMFPFLQWEPYLNYVFENTHDDQQITVSSMKYFKALDNLIINSENSTLVSFLLWRLLEKMVPGLDSRFQVLRQKLDYALYKVPQGPESLRWQFCMQQTDEAMGLALGEVFLNAAFNKTTNDVDDLLRSLQTAFIDRLELLSWMDNHTRDVIKGKVENLSFRLGGEIAYFDPGWLDSHYANIKPDANNFFVTLEHFHSYKSRKILNELWVDRDIIPSKPHLVSVYYSLKTNKLLVRAGIMQPPMYNWTYLRSMKFAELGNAIGRGMIRGFYGEGSSHDVNGTSSAFELHCQCFINQYSNYSVKHHFLNGTATLEEHLEDNGGLNIALQAYNKWQGENTEYLLPFLNLTQQQVFFVRYAQTWCSSESESFLQEQLREGNRSPARFRVLGTLSNSPEFSQHFHCPLDSPMNPSRKCTLW